MKIIAKNIEDYLQQLPEDRQDVVNKLRDIIRKNLSSEFEEALQYDMISYVVPKSKYPKGYHCNPEDALAFISKGSQKNHLAVYHMGVYMFPEVYAWFVEEYPKHMKTKLNMGKSCIRFTNMKTIPYELLEELCQKISLQDFVDKYEEILAQR